MGCDIHAYTEIKNTKNNKWFLAAPFYQKPDHNKHYSELYLGRDYAMFAQLADVRNYDGDYDDLIIDTPRDLPRDCSDDVRHESNSWGVDGHSHSYLTLKELKAWVDKHPTIKYDDDPHAESNPINVVIEEMEKMQALFEVKTTDLDNIRLVFWFDN